MSRLPNTEQLLAIEHQGGVLLKAGAGSGKTFVLVEHVVYLVKEWEAEFKHQTDIKDFNTFLGQKFSTMVLMTFTKLAAAEIKVRLFERFEELADQEPENCIGMSVLETLDKLSVSTIDSFCSKLIRRGYFPGLAGEFEMIMPNEIEKKINFLFEQWLKAELDKKLSSDSLSLMVREKKSIVTTLTNLMQDPSLRIFWSELKTDEIDIQTWNMQLIEMDKFWKWNDFLSIEKPVPPLGKEKLKWVEGMSRFSFLPQKIETWDDLILYYEFYSDKDRNFRLAGIPEENKDYFVHFTAFRESIKGIGLLATEYKNHFELQVKPWFKLFVDLVKFVDTRFSPQEGLSYGDLEYHVYQGLKNPEIRNQILKDFNYFVVDEFQDTSWVQYEILKLLADNDFSKIFCVGDAKQAIYGFRGGELGVFLDCENKVERPLLLSNNYRSESKIIAFNNDFFTWLFAKGIDFEDEEIMPVKVDPQMYPGKDTQGGHVNLVRINASMSQDEDEDEDLQNEDQIEAEAILDYLKNKTSQEVCILYRKLTASIPLIEKLIKNKITFSAQVKVAHGENPLSGLLLLLLERELTPIEEFAEDYWIFLGEGIFDIMGLRKEFFKECSDNFRTQLSLGGMSYAFTQFILNSGLRNAEYEATQAELLKMIVRYLENPERVYTALKEASGEKVTLHFKQGSNPNSIKIMTAHSSKGLEFEEVIVAGLFTNGREKSDHDLFGGYPGSFKWSKDLKTKEKISTPQFYFEKTVNKYKSFSESKRLFYVAGTRAQKKLTLFLFDRPSKGNWQKNSWGKGLQLFLETLNPEKQSAFNYTDYCFENKGMRKSPTRPLFHYDQLGMHGTINPSRWGMTSELSVTALASLEDCPRKFYFKNILKLDEKYQEENIPDDKKEKMSSMERGTKLHEAMAHALTHNYILSLEMHENPDKTKLDWALNEIKKISQDMEIISEVPVKFPFFSFMINGTPDLILKNSELNKTEIWDFKTGGVSALKEKNYWFQLKSYALALYQTGKLSKNEKLTLKLCYLDHEKISIVMTDYFAVTDDLFRTWKQLNSLEQINLEHCLYCSFKIYCNQK